MNNKLEHELNRLPLYIRRRYFRLRTEDREDFNARFLRHLRMCEKSECGIDPGWVREALMDAKV